MVVSKTETVMIKTLKVSALEYNNGQIEGLPKNPRFFRDKRFEAMKKSIKDCPEMLELRELIVVPHDDKYVVICGNLRLRASKEVGLTELPCKVLDADTAPEKLREYASKDNVSFGENDMDILLNEWSKEELAGWGFEFAEEKVKDPFEERMKAITDDNAVYPLIPKFDEKYELFIIVSSHEVDANWLRETLGMQKMQSYKTGKLMKSNVVSIEDVRHAICYTEPQES